MNYLTIFISPFLFNLLFSNNIWENKLLFCLDKEVTPLIIKEKNIINNNKLNKILNSFDILLIEPWLNGATEDDFDNDIYLNRIYRITILENNIDSINKIKKTLESLDSIYSVEYEYYRKPLYTPNDQYYNSRSAKRRAPLWGKRCRRTAYCSTYTCNW